MALELSVDHRQGDFHLRAEIAAGDGVTALFGRSGSGKTTLVNMIAGLVTPQAGRIAVDGDTLVDTSHGMFVPPHRRRIGYVFQEGRLFPHLTVRRNLLYGRWFNRSQTTTSRFDDVVALLGIGPLLARHPASLSGGEKQRVAIGRALLANPRLLLMDEPLAALDEARKSEILPYIERLRDAAGIPIVYVSHAVAEVARLATTIVALENGRVTAAGPATEVMARLDVAPLGRAEAGALLDAEVTLADDGTGLALLRTQAGDLRVPNCGFAPGAKLRVQILARDVMIALDKPQGISALNVLAGTVAEIDAAEIDAAGQGASVTLRLDCGGAAVLAQITRRSLGLLGLRVGQQVHAVVKSVTFAGR